MDRLGPFEAQPLIAVAVSGGGDSRALADLAAGWARARGGRVAALTVDHGLRSESAAEARRVGVWMADLGLAHRILRPGVEAPPGGLQAWARRVRLELLTQWCRSHGVLHLLLAHQGDDQAETHLMRRARAEGPGEAGMPARRIVDGVRLLRPLLGANRAALRAYLATRGHDWLEDPSNADRRFERVRLRQRLGPEDRAAALVRAADRAEARQSAEGAVAEAAARVVSPSPAGYCLLDLPRFAALPEAARRDLLARITHMVGGGDYATGRKPVGRLDTAISTGDLARGRTLAGCRILPWHGRLLVCREHRARTLAGPVTVPADGRYRWDRFLVDVAGIARPLRLGALGTPPPRLPPSPVPAPARASLPALFDSDGPVIVPHLGHRRGDAGMLSLRTSFAPTAPIAPWPFVAARSPCAVAPGTADCGA